jgi:hypothetical protein
MQIKNNIEVQGRKKYPFNQMNVGQCLEIYVNENENIDKLKVNAITSARSWARYHQNGVKFSCSIVRNENLIRIWRVK